MTVAVFQGNISTVVVLDREERDLYTFLVLAWDSPHLFDTASAVVSARPCAGL